MELSYEKIKKYFNDAISGISQHILDPKIANALISDETKIYKFDDSVLYVLVKDNYTKTIIDPSLSLINSSLIKHFKKHNIDLLNILFITEDEKIIANTNFVNKNINKTNRIGFNDELLKLTFQGLIVSQFNNQAHRAAKMLVSTDIQNSSMVNPLFIYGNVGVGKTHIALAAANHFADNNKSKQVYYIEAEQYHREFSSAAAKGTRFVEGLKNEIEKSDLLVIDDFQNLRNSEKAIEVFFNIFNIIKSNGGKIIITADKTPDQLSGYPERLISRFSSGLICQITSPSQQDALKVIKNWLAHMKGLEMSEEAQNFIADIKHKDIRKLLGLLNNIKFWWEDSDIKAQGLPVTKEFIIDNAILVGYDLNPEESKKLTPEQVIKIICSEFNLSVDYVKSEARKKEAVQARSLCFYVLKKYFNYTLVEIGRVFGGRRHTTVINAYDKIEKEINNNKNFENTVRLILNKLDIE